MHFSQIQSSEKIIDIIYFDLYNNIVDEQSSGESCQLSGLLKQSISVEADATEWLCCKA